MVQVTFYQKYIEDIYIKYFHSGFMAVCPLGLLTMDNIYDMYAMPKHRAKIFINQIFKLFDKNNSGEITFRVRVETLLS